MTMHLVRGMSSLSTKRRKMKKKPGWNKAVSEHEKFLKKMGVENLPKSKFRYDIPDYKTRQTSPTSDSIGNGVKKNINTYTGDQIIGISAMHKSNLVPVTNKKNAIDLAKMRR